MLREIGVSSFEELLTSIPPELRLTRPLNIPPGLSELEVRAKLTGFSSMNQGPEKAASFLGAGCYEHYIPAAVNQISSRSEFVTAYTPYQPEVAQGTLQVIYEFQSMICELFAMEVANASLYDAGSALAEAVLLAGSQTGRTRVLWPKSVHPNYRAVTQTLSSPLGMTFVEMPMQNGLLALDTVSKNLNDSIAAVVIQYPNFLGLIEDLEALIKAIQSKGALAIIVTDPMAMGVLEAPGAYGADIVVGEGQSLGNPASYGGPYLGLFACKEKYVRRMPGRIAGITKDVDGRRGFVLTLQTREQHIRRDKATSNICTNEGLCATRATFYMALLGPQGFANVGELCLRNTHYLRSLLSTVPGVDLAFDGPHFKEFAFRVKGGVEPFLQHMRSRGFLAGVPLSQFDLNMDDYILAAVTECHIKEQIDAFVQCVREFLGGRK